MSIRGIEIDCDTPDCGSYCSVSGVASADEAREYAADRWGWTHCDGQDICGPCSRGDTPQARSARQTPGGAR